jgi:hypothetical protein
MLISDTEILKYMKEGEITIENFKRELPRDIKTYLRRFEGLTIYEIYMDLKRLAENVAELTRNVNNLAKETIFIQKELKFIKGILYYFIAPLIIATFAGVWGSIIYGLIKFIK